MPEDFPKARLFKILYCSDPLLVAGKLPSKKRVDRFHPARSIGLHIDVCHQRVLLRVLGAFKVVVYDGAADLFPLL